MRKKRTKTSAVVTLALLAGLLCSCAGRGEAAVIVAGSTSVQPYAEILAEEFMLINPACEIDVQGGGSTAGIMAAESGAADIGMSSRALKEAEKGLWSVEIAKDGLAVIVHPDNPVNDLTFKQIRGIYTGEISDWGQVGGPAHHIHLIAREEGSGTRSAFEDLVMDGSWITLKAIIQDSNGAIKQLVEGDRYAIGFISLGLVDATVKALRLEGAAATRENVINGNYRLYRPFLFIADHEPTGLANDYIDFVLSEQGQRIMSDEGLIPE